MTGQADILTGLGPIRSRFMGLLRQRQAEIQRQLETALSDPARSDCALHGIEGILHKIAGTAGTLGLRQLGDCARQVEYEIVAFRRKGDADPRAIYCAIIEFLELSRTVTEDAA